MSAIREDVGRIYITFMEEVKVQHNALADTLESIVDEAEGQQMLEAEFAYLQVRRICELLALAVIAAHNRLPEARSRSFLHEYNASLVFKRLADLNPLGFSRPFVGERTEDGRIHLTPIAEPAFNSKRLSEVYNRCGDMLHVGKLAMLIHGPYKVYDIAELRQWCFGLAELLSQHVIYLPSFDEVLIATLKPDIGEGVQVTFGNMRPELLDGRLTGTAIIYHIKPDDQNRARNYLDGN
jgi:hypothetical protein